ncbi:PAS domain S-box protein [Hydrogenophaga sp.]|uniref:PAS domain S-box protein n=1 Tax=Hydrogenophaga sp. TaxID=1904254 RepID=UPI0027275EE5|nr:PAS domain S-box protein [Hydrogenophaga sp.]MDO9436872.1 PAS domain S-box protein [Hydrogenophaga sp.]
MTTTPATEAAGSEARHAYLLALNDTLRPLGDPVDIQAAACRLLGQCLQAHRVAYFDVRGDDYLIERDYTHGVPSIVGRYPVIAFGQKLLATYRRGEVVVEPDVAADTLLADGERALYAALQLGAHIGVPLVKNGQFVVGLAVHSKVPRAWTPEEVALVQETAEHTWAAVERSRAESALARSEQHYRTLFDSIDQGLCTIEVLFDPRGKPNDYRFLQMNAAFERQTGLVNAVGQRMRSIEPAHEPFWYEVYGQIALSGEPRRFEHAAEALNRHYDVFAFRVGAPEDHQVAVLFNDITERKRREAQLAFLSDISSDLVRLSHDESALNALSAKIACHLGASRCELMDINHAGNEATVGHGWHRSDLPDMRGVYRMTDFMTEAAQRSLHQGDALVVDNAQVDARVNADALASLGIVAFICAPIARDGRARFMLAVKHTEARDWRADEIELMRELTDRIWTRLEQARAEEALKVSDARQRALFSQMLGGVAETDLNGRFTSVNRRYCEILGYSSAELMGMRMQDILYEEDRPANLERRERLIRFGEQFEIEKRYVRKDGSIVWVHNSLSRLSDRAGKPLGIISVTLDISERKRQEEQMQRGAEMLDFIIQHSPSGFYIVDADFRISHVNAETQARAFRNVNPAIGRRLDDAMRVLWPEPLATELIGLFRHTLDTGEPYVSDTLISQRADIEEVETYNWQLQRLTMPDGRHAVMCFYYDTTRLRRAEQELREADQRKDEFLATLAHELRNPLAPIRNSLHILRLSAQSDGQGNERVHDMLERQVSHMVRLVDDLMEVSRITRGKFELRKEPLDLSNVVQNAIDTCKPLMDTASQKLFVDLPAGAPLVLEADAVRLAQVLANLLNNASKYTESGGHIWLNARREGADVVVSVRDNGTGITADMLPRIFDLFTQGDSSYHRAQGGLGIGLTLVRSIVGMHGGSVEARSEGPGHGSEFLVRLPLLVGGHVAQGTQSARPTAAPMKLQRVLVVDDNRDAADSLEMVLQFLGADVRAVYDGQTALEVFNSYQPSAVFLDIGMPGMDGFEVAHALRQTAQGRDAKLIALTGWGQPEDLRRSREAGFDSHLVKPVDVEALQGLLASLR